jgi:hypothetical protein
MAIGRIPEPGTGIPESIIAAKGDLLTGTANDTPAVLTVGANGTTLVADSAETTGLKWATPASSSPASATAFEGASQATTSTSFTDLATAGPAVTLTTGTKVLVIVSARLNGNNNTNNAFMDTTISGATTRAATTTTALESSATGAAVPRVAMSRANIFTVTAGSNTFTAKYSCNTGGATFSQRDIIVIDLGS